jgi:hypothetical protein
VFTNSKNRKASCPTPSTLSFFTTLPHPESQAPLSHGFISPYFQIQPAGSPGFLPPETRRWEVLRTHRTSGKALDTVVSPVVTTVSVEASWTWKPIPLYWLLVVWTEPPWASVSTSIKLKLQARCNGSQL